MVATAAMSTSLALLMRWGLQPCVLLARHWQRELAGLPDRQVPVHLQRVAQLGDAGTAVLVESLADPRPSVSRAAQMTIFEQMERWQLVPTRQSSQYVETLVATLARKVWQLSPRQRRVAADLATKVLLWPLDESAVNRDRLVTDCETVLKAARSHFRGPDALAMATAAETIPARPGISRWNSPHEGGQPGFANPLELDLPEPLPGGRIPIEVVTVPALPPQSSERNVQSPDDPPALFQAPASAVDISTASEPGRFSRPLAGKIRRPQSERADASDGGHPSATRSLGAPDDGNEYRASHEALPELGELELMQMLHSPNVFDARAASAELERRSFNASQIELGRRLTDPDVTARLSLVEALPHLNVDAYPWLFQLIRDHDPRVRTAAATILSTGDDPHVIKRLQWMELDERDESVRSQLRQILKRHR